MILWQFVKRYGLKLLKLRVPVWALVVGLAIAASFLPFVRGLLTPEPEIIDRIIFRDVDKPYPVSRIVTVPREVIRYAPAKRDTVVQFLVPTGVYGGAIPFNRAEMPAVRYTMRNLVLPVAQDGRVTEYVYSLYRANRTFGAEVGAVVTPVFYGPSFGFSINQRRFWLTGAVVFDLADEKTGWPVPLIYARWRF